MTLLSLLSEDPCIILICSTHTTQQNGKTVQTKLGNSFRSIIAYPLLRGRAPSMANWRRLTTHFHLLKAHFLHNEHTTIDICIFLANNVITVRCLKTNKQLLQSIRTHTDTR